MNQVRVHGDPFGEGPDSSRLRSFLRLAVGCGLRCSLSLSGACAGVRENERVVELTDGVRDLRVGTCLPPAEIDLLLRAAGEAVAATAPVVVFAPLHERTDARLLAGLEWPLATAVVAASENHSPQDLLERVRAESRWAGSERPRHAMSPRELRAWLDLPPVTGRGPVVHVGGEHVSFGTDLLLAAWSRCAVSGVHLRLVVPPDQIIGQSAAVARALGARAAAVEIVAGPVVPAHVVDAAGIVLPLRSLPAGNVLVAALASGRPVAASRWAETAALLGRPGTCLPIGGRRDRVAASDAPCFTPDARSLVTAVRQIAEGQADAAAMGARARVHVQEHFTADRPAAPPAPPAALRRPRATVVLEAPFFETSSSSELSIETARALCRRGNVELRLVPTTPFAHDVAAFRRRAPELLEHLCRTPGAADLWLSSGWPVRSSRPVCRVHALRVDWEYGALPVALTPHVDCEADLVVVHSEHVRDVVQAAGRPAQDLRLIPHGVDVAMHEHAPPDERLLAWKAGRPAVLFCGGLIWRKGLDAFFAAAFAAFARNPDFVLVVKSVGHDRHYGRHHLRELVDKVQRTPGAPPLLLVTDDLDRAQMASLYTACDVLLHPFRGEGFGLPILEARACGLPVVATRGGGADTMLTGPGAFGIDAVRRAVELPEPHVDAPWVLEPSSPHAAQLLRAVLDDLPATRAAARQFAGAVRAAFTWDAAAEQIEQMARDARVAAPAPAVPEPIITLPTVARRPEPALR